MANLISFFKLSRGVFRSLKVNKNTVLSSTDLKTGVTTNLVKCTDGILNVEVNNSITLDGNIPSNNTPCFRPFLYETPIKPSRFKGKYVIYTILTVYIFYVLCIVRYIYLIS
ncbi:hypothetical protein EV196_11348 [Mariniflexile fucanivorans]|uniref:Uncharacterized protein n=1 Tax=Mariniflexile fucanivorans TaxID=264023 RepID=A0A4R1R9Y3_9FLAO|nr:hypothetical protein EV196_11348 [Mariniflexile fucanivorans]